MVAIGIYCEETVLLINHLNFYLMKKFFQLAVLCTMCISLFTSCNKEEEGQKTLAVLSADGFLQEPESFYLSNDTTKIDSYYIIDYIKAYPFKIFQSRTEWGFGHGFVPTNCTDITTPGYTNLSAITAKGQKTASYFIVNTGGSKYGQPAELSLIDNSVFEAVECFVTNSTYAYLAIKDGNDGFGSVKQWTAQDKYTLSINGYLGDKKTGTVTFMLADGMDIINKWQRVDLSPLGNVNKIVFELTSTDNGEYGMNTPSYFCLDRLTIAQ